MHRRSGGRNNKTLSWRGASTLQPSLTRVLPNPDAFNDSSFTGANAYPTGAFLKHIIILESSALVQSSFAPLFAMLQVARQTKTSVQNDTEQYATQPQRG